MKNRHRWLAVLLLVFCALLLRSSTVAAQNQAPVFEAAGIYRTHPGETVNRPTGAVDPDGDTLGFSATGLPTGATIDSVTGKIQWEPGPDQLGPFYVTVTATDDGEPSLSTDRVFPFHVAPDDECVDPNCDPASGCEDNPVPLDLSCCEVGPAGRPVDAMATCPEGRLLHVGRNLVGFGPLQNCDRLPLQAFAQGGVFLRMHAEATCLSATELANLSVRLENTTSLLIDQSSQVNLAQRSDGFVQILDFFLAVSVPGDFAELEGTEAELTVTLTDHTGEEAGATLRVVLTLDTGIPDLPDPDGGDDEPADEPGCVGCHRPEISPGVRVGIEPIHRPELGVEIGCVDCHGGDNTANTKSQAHVPPLGAPEFLRNLSSDQIDNVGLDYLRFINPSDLRVAATACGDCHPTQVATVPLSVMSTYAGHYTLPRFLSGSQPKGESIYAAVDVTDGDFDPLTAPPGTTDSLEALREPDPGADRNEIETVMDTYLPKSCPTCHFGSFGRNQALGAYRSSGCAACHITYADDGLSRSDDPRLTKSFPPHPMKHQFTTAIPVEQCTHCHFQGGRIGLSYRGIREGGFSPERTPPNAVPLGVPLYGHGPDFYFSDEDDTNEIDETPPDLHYQAGMACVDCHVGGDVHGDGNLYVAERYQVGIRCEDCHGTVRAALEEDLDGLFKNSKGFPLKRMYRNGEGAVVLSLASSEGELPVPQIHDILASGRNARMVEAMGVKPNGFSHTDSLECYSCHTSWRPTCFGCHITVDDTGQARNLTTGRLSDGAISVVRDDYSNDFFTLGLNRRGKLTPLCSSMTIFMNYIDEDGNHVYEDRARESFDGRLGFGWNPFQHHTVSKIPQNCDRCHQIAAEAGPDNNNTVSETWGFGNGRFMTAFNDANGVSVPYDMSAYLDDEGNLIADFPNPGTGPAPRAVREAAMSIEVFGNVSCRGQIPSHDNTFEAIQRKVFDGYGCSSLGCHDMLFASGGLVLTEDASYGNLVGADSNLSSDLRVNPGDHEASFLWQKLAVRTLGQPFPSGSHGIGMPLIGSPVGRDELTAIERWIDAGAPETAVVPGTVELLGQARRGSSEGCITDRIDVRTRAPQVDDPRQSSRGERGGGERP